ncbi:hypothetical protein [Nitrospira lenta]|uniref:Uncharacterized protein n=1 Tax=Nitrospira lenta TaxID=1436998 RepID=A0A330L7P1_9BACT|nr:hypothetical protein [Nitrospira lenta]SPP65347.1 conserved exported hypothetical protein [Nitrospira lenta]
MAPQATVIVPARAQHFAQSILIAGAAAAALLLAAGIARAESQSVPWECSTYDGEAQTRCLNMFIELQREEIGKLKGQLQAQQGAVEQLKQQSDRQAAATAEMQRQIAAPPAIIPAAPYSAYTYAYPPALGLGLYLGRPGFYGYPNYYGPHIYWGPRYYRHWGRR